MVEFALILPMLLLVLMGIIEFGWVFTQAMDVRHAAREGARIAAVNYDSENTADTAQTTVIRNEICRRMSGDDPSTVDIRLVDNTKSKVGDYGIVTVDRAHSTLSNFFRGFPLRCQPRSSFDSSVRRPGRPSTEPRHVHERSPRATMPPG